MDSVLSLKVGAIFELFCVSALGYALPFILGSKSFSCQSKTVSEIAKQSEALTDGFKVFKSFSTGIIIGVVFLHLLPEANEALSESTEYPRKYIFTTTKRK
jgi:hypothetical protein